MEHLNNSIISLLSKCSDYCFFAEILQTKKYHWSQKAVRELGLPSETTGPVWETLLHPDDLAPFLRDYKKTLSGELAQLRGEYHIKLSSACIGQAAPLHNLYHLARINGWLLKTENGPLFSGIITALANQSAVDPVTNLQGNYEFRSALKEVTGQTAPWSILILGIDEFKRINDLYSYSFGDKVLHCFAIELLRILPAGASLYRLDGDGFGILLSGCQKSALSDLFQRIQKTAEKPRSIDDTTVTFTVSCGICIFDGQGNQVTDSEALYRSARMALRTAKANGKSQLAFYSDEIYHKEQYNMRLLEKLRESVVTGFTGFSLVYQPLIAAKDESLYGCEVLLRWSNPAFPDGISPQDFVPVLESSGLILEVGRWVLKTAVKQCAQWLNWMPEFQMSINATSGQFEEPDFKRFVMDTITKYGVKPTCITLELTESVKITDGSAVSHAFDFFRSQGIKIAFDDFGTGFASLDVFRILSADELKIDKSFLDRLTYDVTDRKIIAQLVSLCHSMGMFVCVEGIETREVKQLVQDLGPELLQGYYYNKPLTAADFEKQYFASQPLPMLPLYQPSVPQQPDSIVYSPLRPAQPVSLDELVDNAYAGIFQVGLDKDFTFLTCNEGYRRMLGYTARQIEEQFQNRALSFVHPDDVLYVNREIRRQLGLGDLVTLEFRVIKADGTPLWVTGSGNVIKNRHGNSSLIVVIISSDLIKKQQLEKDKEFTFYKSLLEHIPTGIKCVRFDTDFTIDYISPGFLSLLGYSMEEINTLFFGKYRNLIYYEDRKVVDRDISEQLVSGSIVTMRYRCIKKDGTLIWVETVSRLCPPDNDGIQRAYSSVVDLSDSADASEKERSKAMASRYQKAVSQWGEILFEYDFQSQTFMFSDNYTSILGYSPKKTLPEQLLYLYAGDYERIKNAFYSIKEGHFVQPMELRILTLQNGHSGYQWYSIAFTPPESVNGKPAIVLGKLRNIDAEKQEWNRLLLQSQRDSMTGLLNKSATEDQIRKALAEMDKNKHCAVFLIDVDNFKTINAVYGHIYGDKVLQEIARRFKSLFRQDDIIGRAGGDEFIAFIQYGGNTADLAARAKQIIAALGEELLIDNISYFVSASIGISCYPSDGVQFYDLYCRADSALYRAKELGKNRYCFSAK